MDDKQVILGLEQDLLTPMLRKSKKRLRSILANGFIEIGQSGTIYDKQSIIAALGAEPDKTITFTQMKLRRLSNHLALVSYKTKSQGGAFVQRYSLWEETRNHWQLIFHEAHK